MSHLKSIACVQIAEPARQLVRLSKHFARKVPVELGEERSHVAFPWGSCVMSVEDGHLQFAVTSPTAADRAHVENVLDLHLELFRRKIPVEITWRVDAPRAAAASKG